MGDLPERIRGNDGYLQKILTAAAKKKQLLPQIYPLTADNSLEIIKEIQEIERMTFPLRRKIDTTRWENGWFIC